MKDTILTLQQAAEQLGVHPRTLMRIMERDEIRGFQIGNRWKFMQSELDAYLQRQQEVGHSGDKKSEVDAA